MRKGVEEMDRKYFRCVLCIVGISLFLVLVLVYPVLAWKPKTHIYLAETAISDVLDNGKVTITNLKTGVEREYPVDPALVDIIRSNISQFRIGCIGPDAYPDIFTGQMAVHPDFTDWSDYLWSMYSIENSPVVKAFILGYLAHSAGDMYGHSLINEYAGGTWDIGENAVKHILVETYIDQQFPDVYKYNGGKLDTKRDLQLNPDVKTFMYDKMIKAEPGTTLNAVLYNSSKGRKYSIGYTFSELKMKLRSDIQEYYDKKRQYDQEYDNAAWYEKPVIAAKKAYYVLINGPLITYKEKWVEDIDIGLNALSETSHRVALALYNSDFSEAKSAFIEYVELHLSSMFGAPDLLGESFYWTQRVLQALRIDSLLELLDLLKLDEAIFDYFLEVQFGLTIQKLKQMSTNPESYFDSYNLNNVRNEPGLGKSKGTAKWFEVPAAYNSVVMIKLLLLDASTINQMIRDTGERNIYLSERNVLLGRYFKTLDGDNQWAINSRKMVLARSPELYYQFFKRQTGAKDIAELTDPALYPFDKALCQGSWDKPVGDCELLYLGNNQVMQWSLNTGEYSIFEFKKKSTVSTPSKVLVKPDEKLATSPGTAMKIAPGTLKPSPKVAEKMEIYQYLNYHFELVYQGRLKGIGVGHQLLYLGQDEIMDWVPATGEYTIYKYLPEWQPEEGLTSRKVPGFRVVNTPPDNQLICNILRKEIKKIQEGIGKDQIKRGTFDKSHGIIILSPKSQSLLEKGGSSVPVFVLLRDFITDNLESSEIGLIRAAGNYEAVGELIIHPDKFKIGNETYKIGYNLTAVNLNPGVNKLTVTIRLKNGNVLKSLPVTCTVEEQGPFLKTSMTGILPELKNTNLVYLESNHMLAWKPGNQDSAYQVLYYERGLTGGKPFSQRLSTGTLKGVTKNDNIYYIGDDKVLVRKNEDNNPFLAFEYRRNRQTNSVGPQLNFAEVRYNIKHGLLVYFDKNRILNIGRQQDSSLWYVLSEVEYRYGN